MDFEKLIAARRSGRSYSGEAIPAEQIGRLIAAARQTPSSKGLYPVEFIVIRDRGMLCKLAQVKTAASGMLKNADAAIAVLGDRERSDAWIEDCSIAMIYMQLMATELGIASCWVQCRGRMADEQRSSETYARGLLGFPENMALEAILALGMPDPEEHVRRRARPVEKAWYERYGSEATV